MKGPQSPTPTLLGRPRSTCRVVEGQAVVEHICRMHAVGMVAEGRDAVVPAGQGVQG